jgi:hypothetical protein
MTVAPTNLLVRTPDAKVCERERCSCVCVSNTYLLTYLSVCVFVL